MEESELWAQFDKAKAKRELKYDSSQHASYEPLATETREYFNAYSQFLDHCHESKLKFDLSSVNAHTCSGTCTFITFGDYAFCLATGNLHICDIARCRASKTFAGQNVCELTGRNYGMDLTLDLGDRSGLREQFSSVVEAKPTHTKVFGPKTKRVKSKTGTKGRKLSKRAKERKRNQSIQYTDALAALKTLLKGKIISEEFSLKFAKMCVKLYVAILPFAEKINGAVVYQLEYHCYVVAYYMKEFGFSSRSVRLLPTNEFLRHNMPDMGDLSKLGLDTSRHTQISKQFMLSIRELSQNELTMLGDSLQALWP